MASDHTSSLEKAAARQPVEFPDYEGIVGVSFKCNRLRRPSLAVTIMEGRRVPPGAIRTHSGVPGLAIQMAPSASSVIPSGARGKVVAQTRRLERSAGAEVEGREASAQRFADDQGRSIRRNHRAVR